MRVVAGIALALVVAGCAAPTTQRVAVTDKQTDAEVRKQQDMLVQDIMADRARLQRVHWKLATGGAALCSQTAALTGIDTSILPAKGDLIDSFSRLYGLTNQPTVTYIAAGSPAEKAGFQVGDKLVSVDGVPATDVKKSIERMRALEGVGRPLPVQITRAGQAMTLTPEPVKGCAYPAILTLDQIVNAFADGTSVRVTRGMMAFVRTDDELALVVGHEMAHNSMHHMDAKKRNAAAGLAGDLLLAVLTRGAYRQSSIANAAGQSYSQEFEAEADDVGLYILASSGYSVEDAPKFWRRMAIAFPASIKGSHTSSHPSTSYRMVALEGAAKEIHDKQASGVAVVPALKDGKVFVAGEGVTPENKAAPDAAKTSNCFLLSNGQCKQ